jgi:hypothetical protein
MQYLKINANSMVIAWNFMKQQGVTTYAPRFLWADPDNANNIFIAGQMETVGTVLKVQRRDAQILFQATWPAATVGGTTTGLIDIFAYVQPVG